MNTYEGFPGGTVVKNLPANAGDSRDMGLIHGSGRSPGGGNCNPLQYSCLENYKGRGALPATVNEASESQTLLSTLKHIDYPQYCKIYLLSITLSRKYVV